MKKPLLLVIAILNALVITSANAGTNENQAKWWTTWPNYPEGLRITEVELRQLQNSGEKMLFVYSGYEVQEIICKSLVLPYVRVPPNADGSTVKLRIPKDYWVLCY